MNHEVNNDQNSLLYGKLAVFYDLFDLLFLFGSKGNPRSGLLEEISDTSQSVLDVCAGTAASSILIADHNRKNRIIGIDISEDMLSVARRKIFQRNLNNLEVRNMSADSMQFSDNSFDVVMISFALHEFEQTLRQNIIMEIARVLKPGGIFLVIDFARQNNRLNHFFLNLWTKIESPGFNNFLDLDWHTDFNDYGLRHEKEKDYSFSRLNLLRKI
jgi:demethylmenaquinone methyltransferase/2-methoxy-6-polyprenyl-1,4-benzoquinol methylase